MGWTEKVGRSALLCVYEDTVRVVAIMKQLIARYISSLSDSTVHSSTLTRSTNERAVISFTHTYSPCRKPDFRSFV